MFAGASMDCDAALRYLAELMMADAKCVGLGNCGAGSILLLAPAKPAFLEPVAFLRL
jgi:hypothetical protein